MNKYKMNDRVKKVMKFKKKYEKPASPNAINQWQ